jgi:hypothetical protein
MAMRLTKIYRSDEEARQAGLLLEEGWHSGRITEAVQKQSQKQNDMIEASVLVGGRTLRVWLMGNDKGAALMRSCCKAVGALDAYEAQEISQDLFPGHDVEVRIVVEKRRGFPDQNRIEEFRAPAASSVISLRA